MSHRIPYDDRAEVETWARDVAAVVDALDEVRDLGEDHEDVEAAVDDLQRRLHVLMHGDVPEDVLPTIDDA